MGLPKADPRPSWHWTKRPEPVFRFLHARLQMAYLAYKCRESLTGFGFCGPVLLVIGQQSDHRQEGSEQGHDKNNIEFFKMV